MGRLRITPNHHRWDDDVDQSDDNEDDDDYINGKDGNVDEDQQL